MDRNDTRSLRALLLGVLLVGMVGTGTELILLGHHEDRLQWIPLVSIGVGLVMVGVAAVAPGRGTIRGLQGLMTAFVLSGLLGVWLHYRGNVEFEKEIYPTMAGWELFREAMTGATPALAPGAMALLGLVGLTYCFRHPALRQGRPSSQDSYRGAP